MKVHILLIVLSVVLLSGCEESNDNNGKSQTESATDIDGNTYKTVKIGDQIWLAENYKCTRYNNQTPISDAVPYDNNLNYTSTYGLLYRSSTILDPNFCPDGWRVPTKDDYIKMFHTAGLKDSSIVGSYFPCYTLIDGQKYQFWSYDNYVEENKHLFNNKSGFDVKAGGEEYYLYKKGEWRFGSLGFVTKFFSRQTVESDISSIVWITKDYANISDQSSNTLERFYVRLIKK